MSDLDQFEGDNPPASQPESVGVPWGAIFLFIGVTLLVVFVVQNTGSTSVRFLGWEGQFPLAIIVLVTAAVSGLLAQLAAIVYRKRRRRRVSEKAELKRLRNESSGS